ncbi:hypothetical protein LP420_28320 [Massilia sp. B-10]|nr:hypothetical protein LP420_28320 [Massilia sp. B-10]UUZ52926.1 hypothetical protein LP419_27890 [Massilia sp. H-1]
MSTDWPGSAVTAVAMPLCGAVMASSRLLSLSANSCVALAIWRSICAS